jgi:Ca2+-binding EF-hand superfamily protein
VKINQGERKRIEQMFRSLDKNNNGTIGVEELKQVYRTLFEDENMS